MQDSELVLFEFSGIWVLEDKEACGKYPELFSFLFEIITVVLLRLPSLRRILCDLPTLCLCLSPPSPLHQSTCPTLTAQFI